MNFEARPTGRVTKFTSYANFKSSMTKQETTMTFNSWNTAFQWALTHGKANCRPCDKWEIVGDGKQFRVAIKFKHSNSVICFAE